MSNAIFPHLPLICKNMTQEIDWATAVKTSSSGRETSLSKRIYPLWKFTLPFDRLYGGRRGDEYETLAGFVNARRGRADDFLFKHPNENKVANQPFGLGDGTKTEFELVRSVGGFSEPVGGADVASASIKVAGITTAVTFNATLNKAVFSTAPASGAALTWSGGYYFRCRFTKDATRFKQFVRDMYDTDIEFKTFRP